MIAPLVSLDPTSIQFKAQIRRAEASSIFEIEYEGNRYALKVVSIHSGDVDLL